MTEVDRKAVGMYAMAARDWSDCIDSINAETNVKVLVTLHSMLTAPNNSSDNHDQELNDLIAPSVVRRLGQLGVIV
jgi:hypothetical protein